MSIGKFDQERQRNFEMDQRELLSHYDNAVVRTLLSIQRHWQLIVSLVALALACLIIPGKNVALANVDAASLVNSEARLIVTDVFLQAVVRRPGLEQEC